MDSRASKKLIFGNLKVYTRLSSFFGRDKACLVSTSNGLFPLNAKYIVVC